MGGWLELSCAAPSSLQRQPVGVESTAPPAPSAWYSRPVKAAKRATLKGILAANTGSSLCCPALSLLKIAVAEETILKGYECVDKAGK